MDYLLPLSCAVYSFFFLVKLQHLSKLTIFRNFHLTVIFLEVGRLFEALTLYKVIIGSKVLITPNKNALPKSLYSCYRDFMKFMDSIKNLFKQFLGYFSIFLCRSLKKLLQHVSTISINPIEFIFFLE